MSGFAKIKDENAEFSSSRILSEALVHEQVENNFIQLQKKHRLARIILATAFLIVVSIFPVGWTLDNFPITMHYTKEKNPLHFILWDFYTYAAIICFFLLPFLFAFFLKSRKNLKNAYKQKEENEQAMKDLKSGVVS